MEYNINSPNNIFASLDNFQSKEEAFTYFRQWQQRYARQGYYSVSPNHQIHWADLPDYCTLVEVEESGKTIKETYLSKIMPIADFKIYQLNGVDGNDDPLGLLLIYKPTMNVEAQLQVIANHIYVNGGDDETSEIFWEDVDTFFDIIVKQLEKMGFNAERFLVETIDLI